jgi:tRNA pseudouridine(55) synthase
MRAAGYNMKLKGGIKVGHGGTLDPLASGLLPIALGEATKLTGRMLDASKVYSFTVKFGAETSTLDLEGEVIATSEKSQRRRRWRRSCPCSPAQSSRCRRLQRADDRWPACL